MHSVSTSSSASTVASTVAPDMPVGAIALGIASGFAVLVVVALVAALVHVHRRRSDAKRRAIASGSPSRHWALPGVAGSSAKPPALSLGKAANHATSDTVWPESDGWQTSGSEDSLPATLTDITLAPALMTTDRDLLYYHRRSSSLPGRFVKYASPGAGQDSLFGSPGLVEVTHVDPLTFAVHTSRYPADYVPAPTRKRSLGSMSDNRIDLIHDEALQEPGDAGWKHLVRNTVELIPEEPEMGQQYDDMDDDHDDASSIHGWYNGDVMYDVIVSMSEVKS